MEKQQFARTFAALENLHATVLALNESVERLKSKIRKNAETGINIEQTAQKVEQVLEKINMVLNEDGSGNNHN